MTHVSIDAELKAALAVIGGVFPPTITPDRIAFMRRSYASPPREQLLAHRAAYAQDFEFEGFGGARIAASVVSPIDAVAKALPTVLVFHSGGMMFGDRFSGLDTALDWVENPGVRLITIEYRLAPEYPDPVPFEDCYASLKWVAANADQLGVRGLALAGASAGAGLAAGVALAARDRNGPKLSGLILDYPMLDDRGITASTYEFDGIGVWDRVSNETGWRALLGDRFRSDDVSPYAAPARAKDLSGLPPTFIDVGSAEIFRDEACDFAARLWASGVDAELHVWPGAFHACDIFAPHTAVSRGMIHVRTEWLRRVLVD